MKEITRSKRLEVALLHLLGYTYSEIEEETRISHGSIANIVREIEEGDLIIPGTTFDQVNDLRQLSFDLKKSGLKSSQALLGITFFKRLNELQITPEQIELWLELVNRLLPVDFSAEEFLQAAIRLHELETSQGKTFETVTEEYKSNCHRIEKLKGEVESLSKVKSRLTEEIKPLQSKLDTLSRERDRLGNDVQIQINKLQELKSRLKEAEEERSATDKEVKDLYRRKVKLFSEVDGKEETLRKLSDIGFSDEDLLRLKAFLERVSKDKKNDMAKIKEDFFSALALYKYIDGLEQKRETEAKVIRELAKEKSTLNGQIKQLEKGKGTLLGEIDNNILSTCQKIEAVGNEAITQIQEQVMLNYGQPEAKGISSMTVAEAEKYLAEGQFGVGSMKPKVEASIEFVKLRGKRAIITELSKAATALAGKAGTTITRSKS